MSSELDSTGHGGQAWSPTPEEFEKLTRWAGEISTGRVVRMYPSDLYNKNKERWLRELLREPKELAKLAPFMKQKFLKLVICINTDPVAELKDCVPLMDLLQHYAKAQSMEKALINFVLKLLANVTMPELVDGAIPYLYAYTEKPEEEDIPSWQPRLKKYEDDVWRQDALSNLSNTARANLKRLSGDRGTWEWEEWYYWRLPLQDRQRDVDCGFVTIMPFEDGEWVQCENPPEALHDEWGIGFVVNLTDTLDQIPKCDFPVRGTLPEVQRQVDLLLGSDTPEIPNVPAWDA